MYGKATGSLRRNLWGLSRWIVGDLAGKFPKVCKSTLTSWASNTRPATVLGSDWPFSAVALQKDCGGFDGGATSIQKVHSRAQGHQHHRPVAHQ